MSDAPEIFTIVNGWLICGQRRVRLDSVKTYARSGNYVALCCGESFVQIDLSMEIMSRGAEQSERCVSAAVADLMTSLDQHFWAAVE